jgi:hypothetical protein
LDVPPRVVLTGKRVRQPFVSDEGPVESHQTYEAVSTGGARFFIKGRGGFAEPADQSEEQRPLKGASNQIE